MTYNMDTDFGILNFETHSKEKSQIKYLSYLYCCSKTLMESWSCLVHLIFSWKESNLRDLNKVLNCAQILTKKYKYQRFQYKLKYFSIIHFKRKLAWLCYSLSFYVFFIILGETSEAQLILKRNITENSIKIPELWKIKPYLWEVLDTELSISTVPDTSRAKKFKEVLTTQEEFF